MVLFDGLISSLRMRLHYTGLGKLHVNGVEILDDKEVVAKVENFGVATLIVEALNHLGSLLDYVAQLKNDRDKGLGYLPKHEWRVEVSRNGEEIPLPTTWAQGYNDYRSVAGIEAREADRLRERVAILEELKASTWQPIATAPRNCTRILGRSENQLRFWAWEPDEHAPPGQSETVGIWILSPEEQPAAEQPTEWILVPNHA